MHGTCPLQMVLAGILPGLSLPPCMRQQWPLILPCLLRPFIIVHAADASFQRLMLMQNHWIMHTVPALSPSGAG
jgi:hypothetical protein